MTIEQTPLWNHRPALHKAGMCLLLAAATFLVYWQVTSFDFINYDDPFYITNNPSIAQGITGESLKWAFSSVGYEGNWHPVTWISHMLDIQFFGMNPGMHHLVNVIFHIFNTIILFIVLGKMTGSLVKSAAVAALFALHPLHIESVAWISERKDVLSTFFLLLTLYAYCRYTEHRTAFRYIVIVLLYILGLLSKPMLVTLPFVLLLLDFWPLKRLDSFLPGSAGHAGAGGNAGQRRTHGLPFLVLEKLPLFLLSLASCIVTFHAQRSGGAVHSILNLPIGTRLANAVLSYAIYLEKTFWPHDLAIFYTYPQSIGLLDVALSAGILLLITAMALLLVKRVPYLAAGWFWYLGTLVPVIGVVQIGSQSLADRYTYIPLVGIFIILVWGMADVFTRWQPGNAVRWATVLVFPLCMLISWVQVGFWQNSNLLFKQTLDVTSNNYVIHNNLGTYLLHHHHFEEAAREYKKALAIKPDLIEARNNLGTVYLLTGKQDEAIKHFSASLRIAPHQSDTYNNLGVAFSRNNDDGKAMAYFKAAVRENPGNTVALKNLEETRARHGQKDQD